MKHIVHFIAAFLVSFSPHLPSHAQPRGPIPFSSSSPIKLNFPTQGSIILFFDSPRSESCNNNLEIYALSPKGSSYERVYIGSIDTDGDSPAVESVFTKKLGSRPGDDLLLLVSWKSSHPGSGIFTKNYAVYIFRNENNGKNGLKRLTDIEGEIGQTAGGTVEGNNGHPERVTAKYKNADDVRRILKNLGYR